jgi:uncharacterized membrane protein YphA (DoxX/SURF4 family)
MLESAARIAMSGIFVSGGWAAYREPGARPKQASALGLPQPELAVRANGLAMTAGGAALGMGILPRLAAGGLICSLVPTTLAGHAFWNVDDPAARAQQRTQFFKNLGLVGGLLMVIAASRPDGT